MQLTLQDELPFVRVTLTYRGKTVDVDQVLLDAGSASSIFAARVVAPIDILPEMSDTVYTVRGIDGILGMDFLTRAGAIIDLHDLRLDFAP